MGRDVVSKAQIHTGAFGKILRESKVRGHPSDVVQMLVSSQNSFTFF